MKTGIYVLFVHYVVIGAWNSSNTYSKCSVNIVVGMNEYRVLGHHQSMREVT